KKISGAELKKAWELTLLNQFHDILPGSAIKDVYEDSKEQYNEVFEIDKKLSEEALSQICGSKTGDGKYLYLFNTTSFDRKDVVISNGLFEVFDGEKKLPYQHTNDGKTVWLPGLVPGKGYHSYVIKAVKEKLAEKEVSMSFEKNGRCVETPFYVVKFDDNWEIASLYDKKAGREVISEGERGNALLAFEDRPKEYDAWNIDAYYGEKCYKVNNVSEVSLVENGEVRLILRIKRRFLQSVVDQDIIFYSNSGRIDFKTHIDWKESQILLKAAFPLALDAAKATYDIQFGNVERPTHSNTSWEQAKFEVCAHKWADLSEAGYGVGLLNDSKYGYDVKENVMRITLLKSGIFPNPDADKEDHFFTYSLLPHEGGFREGGLVKEGYLLNQPVFEKRTDSVPELTEKSYFTISESNVVAETIKESEDGKGFVVRMYEAHGKRTKAELVVNGFDGKVWECDLLERNLEEGRNCKGLVSFEIKPYEIKTFKFVK
nr:alpha-mannosidase [Lachnospiraceae bacterium]